MAKKRRFDFTKKNKRSGKVENVITTVPVYKASRL